MVEYDKKIFASNLKRHMYAKNVNSIDVASHMGVSKSIVSEWRNGKKMPRMDKIERLALYFGIQKSDLIEEKCSTNIANDNTEQIETPATTEDDERAQLFVKLFSQLNPDQQDMIIAQLKGILSNQ